MSSGKSENVEPKMVAGEKPEIHHSNVHLWVEEHGDYLYRYGLRHFRDHQLAEEMVQETFLAAIKAAERFQGNSSVRTWLTSILRHKIIDRLRQGQREGKISFDEMHEEGQSGLFDQVEHWTAEAGPREWEVDPEVATQQKQFMAAFEACLKKLPEKFRGIFLLREMDGLSREEICEQFQLSANNVGVILHRARLQLRGCIQSNWL